jgi:hypothetical protein
MRTISTYLKRWGFTAQRPTKRAYQQDTERVQRWIKDEYPAISERAKQEHGEIYWADETVQNTADYQRGFAPKEDILPY